MMLGSAASPFRRLPDVSLYFACHLGAACLFALPTVALVAGTGVGRFPEGDRLLFEPGGLVLADVARTLRAALPAHVASGLGSVTLLGLVLLLPHAALLVTLARDDREGLARTWGRAVGHLPALFFLSGLAFLAQVVVFVGASAVGAMIRGAMSQGSERTADLSYLAVLLSGALLAAVLGITRDLGRAAVVRGSLGGKAALALGLRALARAPARSVLAWATPALAAVAFVALGAVLTTALDVSRPGEWRVWLVALVHQVTAFALCFCRTFWLSASLGLVASNTGRS